MMRMAVIISCGEQRRYLKLLQRGPLKTYVRSLKKFPGNNFHFFILINTAFTKTSKKDDLWIENGELKYQTKTGSVIFRPSDIDSVTYVYSQASPGFLGMFEATWNLIMEIRNDFDLVLRTNVSSYWNPSALVSIARGEICLDEETVHAKVGLYTKSTDYEIRYPSGSGCIIFTSLLSKLEPHLYPIDLLLPDDVNLGVVCLKSKVKISPIERMDINSLKTLFHALWKYESTLHFRVRSTFPRTSLRSDFIYMSLLSLRNKVLTLYLS
jgi:hypothetical protein